MKNDINTNGRAFKFQFDLQIQKIKLLKSIDIPKSSYLEVVWRRGQKNISTKIKPQVKGSQEQIFFGQTLSMISTCFLNTDSNQFSPKDSTVSVVIYISGSQKLFGSININLCSVLSSRSNHERGLRYFQQQLNGRTKSKIILKLSSTYLTQMMKSDEQSIGSGVHSNSYNNTSSYSITDQRKLTDIPSKDTYSVLSYGGYGSGARYSAKKQDASSLRKEDSAKKIQQQASKQYGSYGYSQPNFYNKTGNQYSISKGTPNIMTIPPAQSSASRLPRNSDSDQNRSNLGQQNSRLLIEEQTRRSKLEAQMTKNKVENDQLKNKLSQYVRENMKLKEELKKFSDNNDSKHAEMKKENEQLRDRNYVMSNQIRQLKGRFDKYVGLERDCTMLRSDKQNLMRLNKQHQDSMNNLKNQLQDFKKQLYKAKENQTKLYNEVKQIKNNKFDIQESKKRQYQNKIKDMNGQLEYYQNNAKNLSILLRETEEKCRNTQAKLKNHQILFQNFKNDHYNKMDDLTFNKDRQIKDLSEKLHLKNQQCTKYILEAQKMKNEFTKIKQEKIAELQYSRNKLNQQNDKLNASLKDANFRIDQLQQQKNSLNNQVRNEVVMRSKETEKTRQIQQKLNQCERKYQRQVAELRKSSQQLQMQNVELNKILSQKTKSLQQVRGRKQQVQNLMKQNLQLQLELKYKNDEVLKLAKVQEQFDKIKCKYSIQENNLMELSDSLEKCQKELKDKNRSYILQCQKTKMLIDERANNLKAYNQIKDQLEEKKSIICNGEKQVQQMDFYIRDLQTRNGALFQQIRQLQEKISEANSDQYVKQIRNLETRNRQLQVRDSEKIKSIENLHKNLNTSNKQIKQLQTISQQRYQEMISKQQIISQLERRIKQVEAAFKAIDQQLNTAQQQKNILTKKNEMIMEELYSYKKKFEEEKGRSHSTVHIRTSEQYIKIKNLQNQLQKKENQIKKLQKELMALQSENINLNIQVMKKLEDITPQ